MCHENNIFGRLDFIEQQTNGANNLSNTSLL